MIVTRYIPYVDFEGEIQMAPIMGTYGQYVRAVDFDELQRRHNAVVAADPDVLVIKAEARIAEQRLTAIKTLVNEYGATLDGATSFYIAVRKVLERAP